VDYASSAAKPRRAKREARRARGPLWARLLVVFGALLMLASGTVIVGYQVVVAAATSGIDRQDLLGNAGHAGGHVTISGAKNILLVGIDARPDQDATTLVRADSIMILHIPAGHDRGYLVSLPRDTYVQIPAYNNGAHKYLGGAAKINAAFAFGGQGLTGAAARRHGFELLALTIKKSYGITFDAGAIVDFQGFQQVVKVLGGVDLCVDEKTTSIHLGYDKNGKLTSPSYKLNSDGTPAHRLAGVTPKVYNVGCRHFAAWEALDYVRQRDLLANKDTDYGRQRHQQQFLKATFKEILSRGVLTSPTKLSKVINTVGQAMTLDDGGISIEDWLYAMRGAGAGDLITIKTNDGQFNSRTIDGQSVEVLSDTSRQLLQSVRDDTVDNFVAAHVDWVSQS
jgi:LCP family protein required for cell wall assembly